MIILIPGSLAWTLYELYLQTGGRDLMPTDTIWSLMRRVLIIPFRWVLFRRIVTNPWPLFAVGVLTALFPNTFRWLAILFVGILLVLDFADAVVLIRAKIVSVGKDGDNDKRVS
jgi:hypothetical protein